MSEVIPPLPQPDVDDAAWWQSLNEGTLLVNVCTACRSAWIRALPLCPFCGESRSETVADAGTGSIYSWVTIGRALDDAFTDAAPYTVALVELDSGARVLGRFLPESGIAAGLRVVFQPYQDFGTQLVGFAPPDAAGGER